MCPSHIGISFSWPTSLIDVHLVYIYIYSIYSIVCGNSRWLGGSQLSNLIVLSMIIYTSGSNCGMGKLFLRGGGGGVIQE